MMDVAIIMGSKNDFPIVSAAVEILAEFGLQIETRVFSA
ncbi:MAG: 5-(carboxyamino)imidazole ribonucleotide mutase, partial [Candidatus Dadabacteria bacterium]|nr:5-(carboxyamino)imidazole ribonucleotide mutase [Candidatus Dadabacteria bacterium]